MSNQQVPFIYNRSGITSYSSDGDSTTSANLAASHHPPLHSAPSLSFSNGASTAMWNHNPYRRDGNRNATEYRSYPNSNLAARPQFVSATQQHVVNNKSNLTEQPLLEDDFRHQISILQKQLEESEERNFELEANIATIQAETTHQVKTETQTWEEKVKYLEKQLQRETTERRMAEVKLSEVKRLSVPGKSDTSLFSPPWKDRRKSDPLHHPPAVRPKEAAMRSSSTIDRTPTLTSDTSAHHAGANTVDNAMAPSSQSTEYASNTGKRDTASKQRGIPVSENKTQQFEKTTKVKDADKKEISSISNSHLLITSASQVAVSLLQDMNDLMASTIRQLHRDDLETYSRGINPLCQDWEKIQSALREVINTNASYNGNHQHTAGIELVVWTVLEIVASRKGNYMSFEASSISNTEVGNQNDKPRRKFREATTETVIMIDGGEERSSRDDVKQSHIFFSKDMEDRPVTIHLLNLLTFLERVIQLSTDARTFLTRELLYSASASEANTMQDIDVTAETATNNAYGLGKTQKRMGDSPLQDEVHSSQLIRQTKKKRRRIFAPRGVTQPDLQVSKPRFHQPTASSKRSFSLFFRWMKSILFGRFMASDYDKLPWEEHKKTDTQNVEDLILLSFLRIFSILFWESGCVSDERQLEGIASSDIWSISGLNSNLRCSIRIGEVLLFSLICSGTIDRGASDEATVDSQESADLNSSRRQSLKSTDLLSSVFRSLRRRNQSKAVSGTNPGIATTGRFGYNVGDTKLSEFQIKSTVINLYQKILASPSGSAFSRRIVFPGCSSDESECVLFILFEFDLCVRFLKESLSLDRTGLSNPSKVHKETAGKEVTGGATNGKILDSSIHAMKVILNITKFLIAYFQVDPTNGVAFLYHNYYLHGESKLRWCHQVTSRRKRHSEAGASGAREKSGISSLVEGLEYAVSALLGDTLHEEAKSQALRLESAYLLGLLINSEMQLFALLLSHIQSVDYLAKSMFGENATSLLHLIGDAKACFRSSCCLISQYSRSCVFIDHGSRCHAQQLLEEIKLDEEEETTL